MKVVDFYNASVKPLPTAQRLELAKLILEGISPQAVTDYSEEWTDEDMQDATCASLLRAAESLGEADHGKAW